MATLAKKRPQHKLRIPTLQPAPILSAAEEEEDAKVAVWVRAIHNRSLEDEEPLSHKPEVLRRVIFG